MTGKIAVRMKELLAATNAIANRTSGLIQQNQRPKPVVSENNQSVIVSGGERFNANLVSEYAASDQLKSPHVVWVGRALSFETREHMMT